MSRHVLERLSDEERNSALVKAREMRVLRRDYKDRMCDGKVTMSEAIDAALSGDEVVGGIRVYDAIRTQYRFGDKRTHELMDALGISERRRMRGLGVRQAAGLRARFA
jgi:hypothetical protein